MHGGLRIVPAELRAELARRGWRQADLARVAGVSRALVGLVCAGMRPSRRTGAAMLAALGPSAAARVTSEEPLTCRDRDTGETHVGGATDEPSRDIT